MVQEGEYYVIAVSLLGCEAISSSVTFTPALGIDDAAIKFDLYLVLSIDWLKITSTEDFIGINSKSWDLMGRITKYIPSIREVNADLISEVYNLVLIS